MGLSFHASIPAKLSHWVHYGLTSGKIKPLNESSNSQLAKRFVSVFSRSIPTKHADWSQWPFILSPLRDKNVVFAYPLPLTHFFLFFSILYLVAATHNPKMTHGDGGTTSF